MDSLTKEVVMAYQRRLVERGCAVRCVNSVLGSVNSLLEFMDCASLRVKAIKQQRQICCRPEQ